MTHYDVDYSKLSPQVKHDKAIDDIIQYMGLSRYISVCKHYQSLADNGTILTRDQFALHLSFAGVQGYPVNALHAEIWPFG